LLERQVRDGNVHAHIYDSPKAPYLNQDFITAAERLFVQAEEATANSAIQARVEAAHLPIWYVQLATGRITGDARDQLLHRFLQVARDAGITHISEGRSLDNWAKSMGAK